MNEFFKKLLASKELQGKFASLTDPEEAHKLALTVQPGLTLDDSLREQKNLSVVIPLFLSLQMKSLKKLPAG